MWFHIATLCALAIGAQAYGLAVSHQNRNDHGHHLFGHHIAHGWGHHGQAWRHGTHIWGNGGHGWQGAVAPAWGGAWNHHGAQGLGHGQWGHDAWSHPAYKFSYSVSDPHTGDHKAQSEVRHGDVVNGAYSLVEPDGNLRSVHYSADAHRGFNAIVHHSTPHHHLIPHYLHH